MITEQHDAGDGRHETTTEQLDRNWDDLLQKLRVIQTGVQFLTGFLLTLPFQQRFSSLSEAQRAVYLVTVASAVVATAFLQAPVSVHRALFRRHERRQTVATAHRLSVIGLFFLAWSIVGVAFIVFSVVVTGWAGTVAAVVVVALLGTLWLAFPQTLRRIDRGDGHHQTDR